MMYLNTELSVCVYITVHTERILRFPRCHCVQILSCSDNRRGQQANSCGDHPLSPPETESRGHMSFSLLFFNKRSVSWSLFVSLKCFSHLCTMTLSSFSNFIPTRLGRMKTWAACNSLNWVTCLPLHFTLAYIVYRESRTRQVVYIHVHCGVDSRLICHFVALFVLK